MAVTVKVLIPAATILIAQTTKYTATGLKAIIDKITATNFSAAAAAVSVNIVTSTDTAGNQNLIVKSKTLQASECYTFPELVGVSLDAGGFISVACDTTGAVNMRASGREIS